MVNKETRRWYKIIYEGSSEGQEGFVSGHTREYTEELFFEHFSKDFYYIEWKTIPEQYGDILMFVGVPRLKAIQETTLTISYDRIAFPCPHCRRNINVGKDR